MANVLISRPIHARSQWELAKVTVVPRPSPMSKVDKTYGFISKRRTLTYIFGVWARELNLADLTRKWCSGSTESFDLSRQGSNPFFLIGDGGTLTLIVHSIKVALYFRHSSLFKVVGGGLQM